MSTELQKTNQQVAMPINFDTIQFDLQKKYLESEISILSVNEVKASEDLIAKTRFFELEKFVYEKDVKISYKLKSVFSALHSVNSSVIFKIVSNGTQCTIYIGVKSKEAVNTSKVLTGALKGNFPGTTFAENKGSEGALKNNEVNDLQNKIFNNCKEITAVVGTPSLKDKEEDQFIQGIENLILGMNGKSFSAIFIADPVATNQVEFTLDAYEQIYSVLSSEKEFVVTDGKNESYSTSFSTSIGRTSSTSTSITEGTNESTTTNSSPWIGRKLMNGLFGTGSKNAVNISRSLEWAVDKVAKKMDSTIGVAIRLGQNLLDKEPDFKIKPDLKTKAEGSKTKGTNHSETTSNVEGTSENTTNGENTSTGTSSSRQKTFTNKKVSNFLNRLDKQIERLEQGKGVGFWNVGAYFISNEAQNSVIAANIYNGVIKGAESNFETAVVKTFNSINETEREKVKEYLQKYQIPQLHNYGYLAQAITTDELTVQINFPHKSVVGLDVVEITPFGNNPEKEVKNNIKIGKLYNYDQIFTNDILLDFNKFTSHIFVTGSTGSGKSNVTYNLIDKLCDENINFLVIEPAKGEYKEEFGGRKNVSVYGTNPKYTELLKINPFAFPENIHVYEHIDRFIEIINACWPMEAAMPNLLKEAVEDAYISKGWLLDESRCIADKKEYPIFSDLLKSLENVVESSNFSQEVKSNYQGALVTRVRSMTNGLNKLIFTNECISDEDLFDKNVIVDLSRVASSEGKALFMGILFMKLNEYRIANKYQSNSNLKHITILEEAHNLLKRTSTNQSADGANLAGKSVEMISNAIAEMRTYGEGFIIADQAPGLLDMSVIRNTNTKICLRLPDFEDRELVGNAMNLTEDQIKELASLETGVAAIYQNDWQEAILCKFDKFESKHNGFNHIYKSNKKGNVEKVLQLIQNFKREDRIEEKDVNFIIEVVSFDFLLRQNWDETKSLNSLKNDVKKTLMKTTNSDEKTVEPILWFVIHLLKQKKYKSKLTNIKI